MSYKYIERAYGIKFEAGQRIVFTEYDDKPGRVMRATGDPQYVRVMFDDGKMGDCHPDSVQIIAPAK